MATDRTEETVMPRRKARRLALALPVFLVRGRYPDEVRSVDTMSIEISRDGFRCMVTERFHTGDLLRCMIRIPCHGGDEADTVLLDGWARVVSTTPLDPNTDSIECRMEQYRVISPFG